MGVGEIISLENPLLDHPVSLAMFLKALVQGLPATVIKYQRAEMTRTFAELCGQDYSLIHFEHVHMSGLMKYIQAPDVIISLNAHNVETEIAQRMRDLEAFVPRKIALSMHAANMARFEKNAFRRSDIIFAVSEREVELIRNNALPEEPQVALVENGVDLKYFHPKQSIPDNDAQNLVFVGSMDWWPNIDGVKWFIEEIWPLIKSRYPSCHFTIVGRNPDPSISELEDKVKAIHVTGTVNDVRPYVWDASAVVVPLRFGSGTRLKILEAFSMGVPVISTSLGCEGISCRDGRHILLADNPAEFAEKCCLLLDDWQQAIEITDQALALVQQKYSWDSIIEKMLAALDKRTAQANPVEQ